MGGIVPKKAAACFILRFWILLVRLRAIRNARRLSSALDNGMVKCVFK
jgi:hypothetical protein